MTDDTPQYAPARYVQVRLAPGSYRYVLDPKPAPGRPGSLAGWRALLNGNKWDHWDAKTDTLTSGELVLFDPASIVGEFRLSLKYGELERIS